MKIRNSLQVSSVQQNRHWLILIQLLLQLNPVAFALNVSGLMDHSSAVKNDLFAAVTNSNGRPFRLVIYDPRTGQESTALEYMRSGGQSVVDLTQLWQPCRCTNSGCLCCLGLKLGESLNNSFCFSARFIPSELAIRLDMCLNERYSLSRTIALIAPPAACMPLLTPLPIYICLRIDNIRLINRNVNMCATLLLRVLLYDLMQFSFGCLRFGRDGLIFHHISVDSANATAILENETPEDEMDTNGVKCGI
ncbi:uncharacterized protein LOC128860484 [Anastrepha ludens]|uniref:uncharacterized protein LOC128860484 n=1 Tax=Anastrepha ludens TaxID=28586 RepID=UPI0023B15D87|nr:uncharacterized protein LOC128860484 [Anastrepha ludens]